jgi:lipopolysaccharide/colanic/teichoic acid biosynthesis glycosyltransferase
VCDNVHRITRVGRWLRRFRLDELPQLLNVLKGEMNLVGPRPHPISNYELFLEHIPHYRWRMVVRPGITGWAQVRYGYANGLGEETEKMRYDLYYLKHRGVGLDLRILLETLSVLVLDRRNHDGAQHRGPDYVGPGRGWQAAWQGSPSRPTPVS